MYMFIFIYGLQVLFGRVKASFPGDVDRGNGGNPVFNLGPTAARWFARVPAWQAF